MKSIVIIGGGFAGAETARGLEKFENFRVTLIDSKNYFEFTPSILRILVNPNKIKEIQIKHKNYLKKTNIVIGKVNGLGNNFIYLKNKKIKYDYLVIATGGRYSNYIKSNKEKNIVNANSSKDLLKNRKQFLKARNIGIIGGGLVGVELAGEIVENFPDKKVSIIESNKYLIYRSHIKAIKIARKFLERNKVKIILNQEATNYSNKLIETDKSEKIPADLIFLSTGINPNSESFKNFLSLDENNYIKVNNHLQTNKSNIFAIGDVNDVKEEKTAQAAENQVKIAVKNIKNIEDNHQLINFNAKKRPLLLSLGKWNAILEYRSLVISGKLPALMKYIVELKTILKLRL